MAAIMAVPVIRGDARMADVGMVQAGLHCRPDRRRGDPLRDISRLRRCAWHAGRKVVPLPGQQAQP